MNIKYTYNLNLTYNSLWILIIDQNDHTLEQTTSIINTTPSPFKVTNAKNSITISTPQQSSSNLQTFTTDNTGMLILLCSMYNNLNKIVFFHFISILFVSFFRNS